MLHVVGLPGLISNMVTQFIQLCNFINIQESIRKGNFLPEKMCLRQVSCSCRNNTSDWSRVDQRAKLAAHIHPVLRLRIYVKLFRQKNETCGEDTFKDIMHYRSF
jgi:hypothetical protein